MLEGVDYSYAHPVLSELVKAGKTFVCRYLTGPQGTKGLTLTELDALAAAGLKTVLIFENEGDRAKGGFQAGVEDGAESNRLMTQLGIPTWVPRYFAVDFDIRAGYSGAMLDYFQGIAQEVPIEYIGAYGGYAAISLLRTKGACSKFWQTYAWSDGIWDTGNHIEQYENGIRTYGGVVDLDRAIRQTYGGFIMTNPNVSAPAPNALTVEQIFHTPTIGVVGNPAAPQISAGQALYNAERDAANAAASSESAVALLNALPKPQPPNVVDPIALGAQLAGDATFVGALADALAAKVGTVPTADEIASAVLTAYGQRLTVAPPATGA